MRWAASFSLSFGKVIPCVRELLVKDFGAYLQQPKPFNCLVGGLLKRFHATLPIKLYGSSAAGPQNGSRSLSAIVTPYVSLAGGARAKGDPSGVAYH